MLSSVVTTGKSNFLNTGLFAQSDDGLDGAGDEALVGEVASAANPVGPVVPVDAKESEGVRVPVSGTPCADFWLAARGVCLTTEPA